MRFFSPKLWVGAIAALALVLSAQSAQAAYTYASYDLDVSNVYGTGQYGTVEIEANSGAGTVSSALLAGLTLNAGDILFKIDVTTSPYDSVGSNFGVHKFAFNILDGSGLNVITSGANQNIQAIDGSGNDISAWKFGDGGNFSFFGDFDKDGNGTGDERDPLYILIRGQGTNADVANVIEQNADGYFFQAHIRGFTNPNGVTSHQVGSTGPTPEEGPLDAPAPGGLVLMASMLPFALVLRRRLTRREATA